MQCSLVRDYLASDPALATSQFAEENGDALIELLGHSLDAEGLFDFVQRGRPLQLNQVQELARRCVDGFATTDDKGVPAQRGQHLCLHLATLPMLPGQVDERQPPASRVSAVEGSECCLALLLAQQAGQQGALGATRRMDAVTAGQLDNKDVEIQTGVAIGSSAQTGRLDDEGTLCAVEVHWRFSWQPPGQDFPHQRRESILGEGSSQKTFQFPVEHYASSLNTSDKMTFATSGMACSVPVPLARLTSSSSVRKASRICQGVSEDTSRRASRESRYSVSAPVRMLVATLERNSASSYTSLSFPSC